MQLPVGGDVRRTDSFIGCLRSKVWQMLSLSRRDLDDGEPMSTGIPSRGSGALYQPIVRAHRVSESRSTNEWTLHVSIHRT